jgi:hypothetical protein
MDLPRRVYLTSATRRHAQLVRCRAALAVLGIETTSRWLDAYGGPTYLDDLWARPEAYAQLARDDLADVAAADTFITVAAFGAGKGGRHVELGYALALGKRVILVGRVEHVFHALPEVEWFDDWAGLVSVLTLAAERGRT